MFNIDKIILESQDSNIIYFENDDEFYEFCVNPSLKVVEGKNGHYTDFDFNYAYEKALKEGKRFVIKDEDSQIYKRGFVSYRTVTKKVENLDPYFSFKKKNKV